MIGNCNNCEKRETYLQKWNISELQVQKCAENYVPKHNKQYASDIYFPIFLPNYLHIRYNISTEGDTIVYYT